MQETNIGISIGLAFKGLGELSKINGAFANFKNGISQAKEALKGLNTVKLGALQEQITSTKKVLFSELTSNLGNLANSVAIGVPIKLAIDDEAAFANVKKYVDDTDENLAKLKSQMRDLSGELGSSFSDIANIAAGGGKINLNGDELVKYTRLLSTASVAFEMTADNVAKAANNMKVGFKLKDVGELNKFFDVVNLLDNKITNANASDILEATSLTAGNANILGLKDKEAAAFASAMLSTGKATSVVGTSLNALYTKLSMADKQGKNFQEALNKIGLDSTYLKTALQKDAAGAITLFLEQLSKADKSKQSGLLYDLIGGNFGDDIAGLLGNIDGLKEALAYANSSESKGSMNKELQTKLETTKSGIEKLTQSWRNLGSAIGDTFLPLSNSIANILSGVAKWLSQLNSQFPRLSAGLVSVVAGLMIFKPLLLITKIAALNLAGGFLGVVKVLSILNPALMISKIRLIASTAATLSHASAMWLVGARLKTAIVLTSAYSAVSKALAGAMMILRTGVLAGATALKVLKFALISTGVGAIVVALGMAAAYLIENWDKVKAFFSNIWESIKPYWQATTQFFSDLWQGLSDFLSGIFSPVIDAWNSLFGGFFDWIGEKFAWVSDMVSAIGNAIGKATSWTKDAFGIGDGKESNWYNPLSWFNDDTQKESEKAPAFSDTFSTTSPSVAKSAVAMTTNGATININFSGGINIATNNGVFDMSEFERQLVSSVKRALKTDEMNAKNRSIIGQ
ncbi:phage tail tape measure protein [Campylobacter hyointestinalis]|uniref:phage tail tape measure protein n=1 Tax=Campylobacter hyointestinalis TaxID=198 RepID=UPI000CE2BCA0|nr:phage tail tape measure protein [Campylobacter hyointestinalis]PPB60464.1 phage tail tape measure protein [Campylobacter hyointestinalis subsp. hyointestinalis]PPB64850.1 phage tail tape measure protein [Campylobacter hyointestinalis subsp. hyointestinalis]PPB69656.1 phage tail tape measure protein [Campylobacter hyointestinalis subsp. hyointestinalis]